MHILLAAATTQAAISGTLAERAQSLLGLIVFTFIAFAIGRMRAGRGPRGRVPMRTIAWGFALQFAFGAIVLFAPTLLVGVQTTIQKLLEFSDAGATMLFGPNLVTGAARVTSDGTDTGTL